MLFSRLGSAEWERAGPCLKTQILAWAQTIWSTGNHTKWKWRHRFFWRTHRNFWTEIFRPAVEPGDIFLTGLWPESCCFSDWSVGDPENCRGDIRITVPSFPIPCEPRVRCSRKSSLRLLQQHLGSCFTQWAGTLGFQGAKEMPVTGGLMQCTTLVISEVSQKASHSVQNTLFLLNPTS